MKRRSSSRLSSTPSSSSYRPIDSYFSSSCTRSSSASTIITLSGDDDGDDDHDTLVQCSQQSTDSAPSQTDSSAPPPRKMTAAMRKRRDADCATAAVLAAAAADADEGLNSPMRRTQSSASAVVDPTVTAVVPRRAMSDISNVVVGSSMTLDPSGHLTSERYRESKAYYHRVRARFAHPDDNTTVLSSTVVFGSTPLSITRMNSNGQEVLSVRLAT